MLSFYFVFGFFMYIFVIFNILYKHENFANVKLVTNKTYNYFSVKSKQRNISFYNHLEFKNKFLVNKSIYIYINDT